ncbi:hypothetical protein BU16DRAFT_553263 [Lophium mytilinum]|uniref:Heterokaryon incompatibility domain-containing protein n=1 Tax=Lophium mytilinum TaxID=390894 RepID=A0A6A6QDF9_9PEZI|nr:hypothetical protein BU16DRAFT_553263 [Lophium mytilinum]
MLRLFPGVLDNPQIDCEMFEAEFDENRYLLKVNKQDGGNEYNGTQDKNVQNGTKSKKKPRKEHIIQYEALSWRWGDEVNTPYSIMIKKDGKLYRKRVSETLGLALKYLRHAEDRILRIDAICINRMIMKSAVPNQVCVWIGEDDDESTTAIRFIREEINELKNFDRLCTDKQHAPKWRALLVVQEIALAQKATVYCGADEISWRELAIAVELFVEVETATHRLSELMKKDDKFALIPNWFEHISELGASLLVNATARIFREYKRGQGTFTSLTQAPSRRSLLSLEYLVTSLSIFDCGRPHDSVYALVTIARDATPLPPSSAMERTKEALIAEVFSDQLEQKPYPLDYNSPYPDVCKEFTLFCIERCAKADPLQALDILCRPWAKDWQPGEYIGQDSKKNLKWETLIKREDPWITPEGRDAPDTFEQYWERAEQVLPVRPKIKQWFPISKDDESTPNETTISAPPKGALKQQKKKQQKRRKKVQSNEVPKTNDEDDDANIKELGLPSWVTRITGAPFDIFPHPGMDMVKMGRKNADPLVGIPQDGHRNYSAGQSNGVDLATLKFKKRARLGHYSLYVKGFQFDRVAEVAQVSQAGAIPASWLDLAKWTNARRPRRPDDDPGDPLEDFWRTLVADRGMHDRNPPYYYARGCKETIMKGGIRSNAVNTTALIYNERNSIIAEFCRRVQAKGALGLVSENVRRSDLICIIYWCTVPIILRKGKRKTEEERQEEIFADHLETVTRALRKWVTHRPRTARYLKKDKTWKEGAEGTEPEEAEEEEIAERKTKQAKADQRDPYRHYEFLGEAYIHGVMDGEAVRQKFYKNKPDHVFEIR